MRVIKIDLQLWWEDDPSGNSELALYGKNWLYLGSSYSLWAGVSGSVTITISTYFSSPCTAKDQTQGLIHVRPMLYYRATLLAPHILRYQPLLYIVLP